MIVELQWDVPVPEALSGLGALLDRVAAACFAEEGIDGAGFTVRIVSDAAIRALNRPDAKTIPIIALTANAFDEDVQRSLQAGMNAHLSKPVEPERLYETLRRLIAAAEQGNHHENASGADSKEEQNDLY